MMDYLASMYIDNELDLDEKVRFVDEIHTEALFYEDTRALLLQEKLLRQPADTTMLPARPPAAPAHPDQWFKNLFKPVLYAAAGFAAAGLLIFSLITAPIRQQCANRFVVYEPAAHRVELAGSFTGWQRTPMQPIRNSGYWELRLQVPAGEHRFAYILDGSEQIADPTLPAREKDDFGGENSILTVEDRV